MLYFCCFRKFIHSSSNKSFCVKIAPSLPQMAFREAEAPSNNTLGFKARDCKDLKQTLTRVKKAATL